MSEQLLDAFSVVDETGAPKYHTCDLVLGDGTQKVKFVGGRAKVPLSLARLVNRNPNIDVPALSASTASVGPDEKDARIAELEALLANSTVQGDGAPVTGPAEGWVDASDAAAAAVKAEEERLEAAREHLREEGLDVPDVEVSDDGTPAAPEVPNGFEATTADGQPRCLAAKKDGGQCANPAVDSGSCALAQHKDQLTS